MDQRFKKLFQGSDECLFLCGGCHVFAEALHERFQYPLVCVRECSSNCVPHAYCRYGEYLVDVMGFTRETQILDVRKWNVPPFFTIPVTLSEMKSYYVQTIPCSGLYGDKSFLCRARRRAEKRIKDYIMFYDGTCKWSIESHPLLKETSEADIESILSFQPAKFHQP